MSTFSARLNRLFDTVYPPGQGPYTAAEVCAALKVEGITMSSLICRSYAQAHARIPRRPP